MPTVLHERDQYMTHATLFNLHRAARQGCSPPSAVVVLVGSDHVAGIAEHWASARDLPDSEAHQAAVAELCALPPLQHGERPATAADVFGEPAAEGEVTSPMQASRSWSFLTAGREEGFWQDQVAQIIRDHTGPCRLR